MKKSQTLPSRKNVTADDVRIFREYGTIPNRLTLRFLALLTKKELARLSRKLMLAVENFDLPETDGKNRKRRQWSQLERVQSERRQRGYIQ